MEIKWNEDREMGITEFDRDHKQLFVIAGKLLDKVRDPDGIANSRVRLFVLREGVRYLRGYFDQHAIREEAYMRSIGYGDYAIHKQLHDEFQRCTLSSHEKILETGECSREEVMDFVGRGIGWLAGIAQELVYSRGDQKVTVLAGLENSLLMAAAEAVYGSQLQGMEALIMSTMEIFSANFWRTVGSRFVEGDAEMVFQENHFLTQSQLQERFAKHIPKISILFDSNRGKFFVATGTDIAAQAESFDLSVGA